MTDRDHDDQDKFDRLARARRWTERTPGGDPAAGDRDHAPVPGPPFRRLSRRAGEVRPRRDDGEQAA
jgi:hypothetical protein